MKNSALGTGASRRNEQPARICRVKTASLQSGVKILMREIQRGAPWPARWVCKRVDGVLSMNRAAAAAAPSGSYSPMRSATCRGRRTRHPGRRQHRGDRFFAARRVTSSMSPQADRLTEGRRSGSDARVPGDDRSFAKRSDAQQPVAGCRGLRHQQGTGRSVPDDRRGREEDPRKSGGADDGPPEDCVR